MSREVQAGIVQVHGVYQMPGCLMWGSLRLKMEYGLSFSHGAYMLSLLYYV